MPWIIKKEPYENDLKLSKARVVIGASMGDNSPNSKISELKSLVEFFNHYVTDNIKPKQVDNSKNSSQKISLSPLLSL